APRLSQVLGCELYFKRDDCTGLASGGNKTRKLEYLIADAKAADADTLITIGGLQSNHARQTAAAAAKFGFACELVLEPVSGTPKTNYIDNGNLLLDHLLGATIHRLEPDDNSADYANNLIEKCLKEGRQPYLIPIGGSNVIGSFGYVRCGIELAGQLLEQNIQLDQIVLATGSAGTQAGLLAGFIATDCKIPVLGISVSRSTDVQRALVENLLREVLTALELNPESASDKVITDGNYVGDGYGIATAAMIDAVKTCARLEGLLLDPVYTGKAMAGLIDLCQKGVINSSSRLLFLHTGGSPGLYGYQEIF
ncbi:MAG: L-cysteate sulfo-lyase, partial [Gammaproteobacteria bacterium]